MKNLFYLISLLALLVSGCTREELLRNGTSVSGEGRVFTTLFEKIESRTYLEDGRLSRWTEGDRISLFDASTLNIQYAFAGETGDDGGTFFMLSKPEGTGTALSANYAVYPYDKDMTISSKGAITLTLPSTQHYVENSYGLSDNTMVAVTKDVDDTFLSFKNVGGCFKFQLYGDDVTVKSITLKGNNGEKIAGKATLAPTYGKAPVVAMADDATASITLDCGEKGVKIGSSAEEATAFWVVVPPTTFEKGITITVMDMNGKVFTQTTDKQLAVERNVVKPMSEIEVTMVDPDLERAALIAFYNATNGDQWKNNQNWCSDKPLNEWFGVEMKDGYVYDIQIITNNISGYIPSEIGNLKRLMRLNLKSNMIGGTIPEELGKLKELKHLHLDHNYLEGEIPDFFNNFPQLMALDLSANRLTGKIPETIYGCTELETLLLYDNVLTGNLLEDIGNLTKLDMLQVHQNQLEGRIPVSLGNLPVLRSLHLNSNNFVGNIPSSLVQLKNLKFFKASANRLNGNIPSEIVNSSLWNTVIHERELLVQQNGYKINSPHAYSSTDYSRNGEIYKLQQHTVGNGIRILFTGDAFSDRLINDGTYEKVMVQAMENFFEIEPYKSYRDRFDVYVYVAVSENEYIGLNTVFNTSAHGDIVDVDYSPLIKALEDSPEIDLKNNQEITCAVIINITSDVFPYRVNASYALDGFGVCNVMANQFNGTLWHEMNGHAFASLGDEYTEDAIRMSEEGKEYFKTFQRDYYCDMNIDITENPDSVLWSHFIKDKRYKSEQIGIYEGTHYGFYGTYRATETSVMNGISKTSRFNAPSRQEIFRRIMVQSGEEYSLEKFLEYDEVNRQYYDSKSRSYSSQWDKDDAINRTVSPQIYKTYNEILKN